MLEGGSSVTKDASWTPWRFMTASPGVSSSSADRTRKGRYSGRPITMSGQLGIDIRLRLFRPSPQNRNVHDDHQRAAVRINWDSVKKSAPLDSHERHLLAFRSQRHSTSREADAQLSHRRCALHLDEQEFRDESASAVSCRPKRSSNWVGSREHAAERAQRPQQHSDPAGRTDTSMQAHYPSCILYG
jgi:hypothetical protein